jgi:hypothetical protein
VPAPGPMAVLSRGARSKAWHIASQSPSLLSAWHPYPRAGRGSTGSNPGAADAAAMTTDGDGAVRDDGPIDALSLADGDCVPSLGATCTADETACQPKDLCSVGYEWFCSAISNSWQKSFVSCGDAATCTLGAACSSADLCPGGIAGCESNCQCLNGTWSTPCPTGLPPTGGACTPEGAECGYPTSTNACGAWTATPTSSSASVARRSCTSSARAAPSCLTDGDPDACWEAHESWMLGKGDPTFGEVVGNPSTNGVRSDVPET